MGRQPRPGGRYVQPLRADGVSITTEAPPGAYTLASGTTYYYILTGEGASHISAHVFAPAGIVITSITVQDCNAGELQVTNHSSTAGHWITEDPSTAFVGVDGTNWTVSASGVVASTGSNAGGAMFHIGDTGAFRTRLEVVVAGTGGIITVAEHGKD